MVRECPRCHLKFQTDAEYNRHSYHAHIVTITPPSSPTRTAQPQHEPSHARPARPPATPQTQERHAPSTSRPAATPQTQERHTPSTRRPAATPQTKEQHAPSTRRPATTPQTKEQHAPSTRRPPANAARTRRPAANVPQRTNSRYRTTVSCQFCGLSFSASRLREHIQSVHLSGSFAIRTPYRTLSSTTRPSASASPPRSSRSKSPIAIHSATLMKRYPCEVCGQSFSSTNSRNQHVKEAHQKLQMHECSKCDSRFARHSSLVAHMSIIHEDINAFKCPWCDAGFGKKWMLQEHKAACQRGGDGHSSNGG